MKKPIKELTEDEVKQYRIIKAFLDAGGTIRKAKEGEGGIYLRGKKLSTEEVMDCIFNPTMTNADRIHSMNDEELAWELARICRMPFYKDDSEIDEYEVDCWFNWLKEEAKEESNE